MNFLVSEDLYYSQNEEWLRVDENLVTIGLTDIRLHQLGEVLFLDLPEEERLVIRGDRLFSIESVTLTHDFIAPVSGTLVEVNQILYSDPGILNDDPFNEGWLVIIEMENEKDLATLMRSEEYRQRMSGTKSPPLLKSGERPVVESTNAY